MKQNIQTIPNALEQVCRLRGCTFEWASPHPQAGSPAVGMIAQELLEQIPECVLRDPRTDLHAVNYTQLVPYLVESIKTLRAECERLERSLEDMQACKRPRHQSLPQDS